MTFSTSSLPEVLRAIALEARPGMGLPMRVESADGNTFEGFFDQQKPAAISLFVTETQSVVEIPIDVVRHLWVPTVLRGRQRIYLALGTLASAIVGILSVQLTGSEAMPGILLGIAVWMALMLWAWFPPVRGWMVYWQLRYSASDANATSIVS